MSYSLAYSHIPDICKQQALQKQKEILASKVLYVGEIVSKGKASKQLSQLVISSGYFGQTKLSRN